MQYTQTQISESTGFDHGELFADEQQVRDYFTVDSMQDMGLGGRETVRDENGEPTDDFIPFTQDELDDMADTVIANHWHMA